MSPSPATSCVRSRPTAAAASLSIRRLPSASNESQQGNYSNYVIQDARHFHTSAAMGGTREAGREISGLSRKGGLRGRGESQTLAERFSQCLRLLESGH